MVELTVLHTLDASCEQVSCTSDLGQNPKFDPKWGKFAPQPWHQKGQKGRFLGQNGCFEGPITFT